MNSMKRVRPLAASSGAYAPRLTGRVFWDLAILMIAFAVAVGLAFPPFVARLGVPQSVADASGFRAVCLLAGCLVGVCNFVLVRVVVVRRIRFLNARLSAVELTLRKTTVTGSWSMSDLDRSHVVVDSKDELGAIAACFNGLVDALEHAELMRKGLEEELRHRAFHDSLTGLPNRALFRDRVDHAVDGRARRSTSFAVLFLDLDDFKSVNDTLGHHAGDALIIEVARRLGSCLRPVDTVARLGGDEFALLLGDTTGDHDARSVAGRLLEMLLTPVSIMGSDVRVGASIGIALPDDDQDVDDLLRHADIAMYMSKAGGKSQYKVFEPFMAATAGHGDRTHSTLPGAGPA